MCNCGNKRNEFASQQPFKTNDSVRTQLLQKKMWPDVSFEYRGSTALSVKGKISGKNYRFNRPGDVQLIDYRDVNTMMAVPVLKRLYK